MASYAGMEDEGGEASLADILIWLAIFAYAPCLYGSYGIWQSTASISRTRFDDPWPGIGDLIKDVFHSPYPTVRQFSAASAVYAALRMAFAICYELGLKEYMPYIVYGLLKELPTALFCHLLASYLRHTYNELVTAGGAMSEQRFDEPSFSLRLVDLLTKALFYGLLAVIVVYCYYYSVHKHSGYICQLADQRGNAATTKFCGESGFEAPYHFDGDMWYQLIVTVASGSLVVFSLFVYAQFRFYANQEDSQELLFAGAGIVVIFFFYTYVGSSHNPLVFGCLRIMDVFLMVGFTHVMGINTT